LQCIPPDVFSVSYLSLEASGLKYSSLDANSIDLADCKAGEASLKSLRTPWNGCTLCQPKKAREIPPSFEVTILQTTLHKNINTALSQVQGKNSEIWSVTFLVLIWGVKMQNFRPQASKLREKFEVTDRRQFFCCWSPCAFEIYHSNFSNSPCSLRSLVEIKYHF